MTTYTAIRTNEEPGVVFDAKTPAAAKAQAARLLESGAFAGQAIRLSEMAENADGQLMRTDRLWTKVAHQGNWVAHGDAI